MFILKSTETAFYANTLASGTMDASSWQSPLVSSMAHASLVGHIFSLPFTLAFFQDRSITVPEDLGFVPALIVVYSDFRKSTHKYDLYVTSAPSIEDALIVDSMGACPDTGFWYRWRWVIALSFQSILVAAVRVSRNYLAAFGEVVLFRGICSLSYGIAAFRHWPDQFVGMLCRFEEDIVQTGYLFHGLDGPERFFEVQFFTGHRLPNAPMMPPWSHMDTLVPWSDYQHARSLLKRTITQDREAGRERLSTIRTLISAYVEYPDQENCFYLALTSFRFEWDFKRCPIVVPE